MPAVCSLQYASLSALASAGNEAVGCPQGCQHIATRKDEVFDPRRPQRRLLLAGAAGEREARAGCGQSRGSGDGVGGVAFVRSTQAGQLGAAAPECRDHIRMAGEAIVGDRLEAAGFEEILREAGTRREVGELAEIGEKHFWSGAGARKDAVG